MPAHETEPLLPSDARMAHAAQHHGPSFLHTTPGSAVHAARSETRRFLSSKVGHYAVLLLVSFDVACIFADFLISLWICEHTSCGGGGAEKGTGARGVERLGEVQEALGVVSLVFSCLFLAELVASLWAFGLA